jgi:hypothetical protein
MSFKTNDFTRMTIDSSGAVLIGSEPKIDTATKLQVSGSDSGVTTIWSNADDVVIENDNSVGITLATPNTGNASIGFADPEAVNAGYVQYNHANNYLRFGTQATERLRIDSDGQVQIKGVGTTGADLILYNSDASIALNQMIGRLGFYKSDASGSGVGVSSSIQVRSDSSIGGKSFMSFHTDDGTLEQERMRIASSGAVFMYDIIGFSGTNSDMRYDSASGQVYYLTSSLRYKSDISNLENSLDKINTLRPVRYKDNYTQEYTTGLIAEEVVETIPEVVFKKEIEGFDEPQVEGVNYSDLVPFLIKSIQELKAEVDLLKSNKCNCKN